MLPWLGANHSTPQNFFTAPSRACYTPSLLCGAQAVAIEGIDYIFDRYAFLGVPRDAPKSVVAAAVRQRRAQNHPDRLRGVGKEVLAAADATRELADRAADILLDDELRPLFDERLAAFQTDAPHLVSETGVPLVDLTRPSMDLDDLLSDDSGFDGTEHALRLSGHSEPQLLLLERLHASQPQNADVRMALRSARALHVVYLGALEALAWAKAGVRGGTFDPSVLSDPEDYSSHVGETIDAWANQRLPALALQRETACALRLAPPLRLLSGPSTKDSGGLPVTDDPSDALLLERLRQGFLTKAQAIRELAVRKQEAMGRLLELTVYEVLGVPQCGSPVSLYLAVGDSQGDDTPLPLPPLLYTPETNTITQDEAAAEWATVGQLRASGQTAVVLYHHPDVQPLLAEVHWAAKHHQSGVPWVTQG